MTFPLALLGTPTSAFATMTNGNTLTEEHVTIQTDDNEQENKSEAKQETVTALSASQRAELSTRESESSKNANTDNPSNDTDIRNIQNIDVNEVVDASNFGNDDTHLIKAPEIGEDTLLMLSTLTNTATENSENKENNDNNTENAFNNDDFFSNIQNSIANFASSLTGTPVTYAVK